MNLFSAFLDDVIKVVPINNTSDITYIFDTILCMIGCIEWSEIRI
jgi:hypothetical protein